MRTRREEDNGNVRHIVFDPDHNAWHVWYDVRDKIIDLGNFNSFRDAVVATWNAKKYGLIKEENNEHEGR